MSVTKKIHPRRDISLIMSFKKKAFRETKTTKNAIQFWSKKKIIIRQP